MDMVKDTEVVFPRREAEFWSNFAVREPAIFRTTQETSAQVWDSHGLSGPTTCERSDDLLATINRAVSPSPAVTTVWCY